MITMMIMMLLMTMIIWFSNIHFNIDKTIICPIYINNSVMYVPSVHVSAVRMNDNKIILAFTCN